MPASGANIKALVALNQAFNDHVRDEERRFEDIAQKLDVAASVPVTLARIEGAIEANNKDVKALVERVSCQNGRVG